MKLGLPSIEVYLNPLLGDPNSTFFLFFQFYKREGFNILFINHTCQEQVSITNL